MARRQVPMCPTSLVSLVPFKTQAVCTFCCRRRASCLVDLLHRKRRNFPLTQKLCHRHLCSCRHRDGACIIFSLSALLKWQHVKVVKVVDGIDDETTGVMHRRTAPLMRVSYPSPSARRRLARQHRATLEARLSAILTTFPKVTYIVSTCSLA